MDALSAASIRRFEDRLTTHFHEHLRTHYDALGELGTRQAIRQGIPRARAHGLQTEASIEIYIHHMFLFGADFDRDPDLPWAANALRNDIVMNESERIARLSEAALTYLRDLEGAAA